MIGIGLEWLETGASHIAWTIQKFTNREIDFGGKIFFCQEDPR
jgi:hypothetical protein